MTMVLMHSIDMNRLYINVYKNDKNGSEDSRQYNYV